MDLFISSDLSIYSSVAFSPLGSGYVSVSFGFPSNSKAYSPFHRTADNYSRTDLYDLRDHLRDVPWEDIFKLGATEFCEWFQVGIHVFVSIIVNLRSSLVHLLHLISNSVVNKGISAISPLFEVPEVLSSASDKAKLFAKKLFQEL